MVIHAFLSLVHSLMSSVTVFGRLSCGGRNARAAGELEGDDDEVDAASDA
jgi:hypothetical protein